MIDGKLTYGDVAAKIAFVNSTQRAQEIAHSRPHPLSRIDMYFTDTISIIISCPLSHAVAYSCMRAQNMIVTLPFIRVHLSTDFGKGVDMSAECLFVGATYHPQAHLSALTAYRSHNRRPVVVIALS